MKNKLTMNFTGMVPQRILSMSDLSVTERKQYHYINRLLRKEFDIYIGDTMPRAVTRKILTLLRIFR